MRVQLYLAAFITLTPAFGFAQEVPESIVSMTESAQAFIASLDDEQRQTAMKEFDNVEERERFIPVPFPTNGLRFEAMTDAQIELAHALMRSGLSAAGYEKASQIIELDDYLVELESARGRAPRFHGSQNYNVSIFGSPSMDGSWAWRIHGHHLYLAFTIVDGKAIATAPAFLGAEPHDVTEGPRAPWRILEDEEELGSGLYKLLDADQKAKATMQADVPREMVTGNASKVKPLETSGIAYGDLTPVQQAKLQELVLEYVYNSPEDIQHERLDRVDGGGWENIRFGWAGDATRGERKYYRVQGPLFLIEYCTVALTPNHVHSVWRDFNGDFGRDLIAEHLAQVPH